MIQYHKGQEKVTCVLLLTLKYRVEFAKVQCNGFLYASLLFSDGARLYRTGRVINPKPYPIKSPLPSPKSMRENISTALYDEITSGKITYD